MLKRYVFWTYIALYGFILVIGLTMYGLNAQPAVEVLIVLSSWSATFVFVLMFRKIYPHRNLWNYIKSQFREKLSVLTVVCVVCIQSLLLIGVLFLSYIVWNVPISEQLTASWASLFLLFGYNFILGPLGEELGWRGFVLNELQKRVSPLKSALIIGILWGFWHLPLWLISGFTGLQLVQYIICFLGGIVAVSIIITAFYNINKNLIIPIIIHQLFNYSIAIQVGNVLHMLTITSILYVLVAMVMVLVNYKKCLYT
ncbi:CPBP family intramembrane glutamic endopeptidase [Shouchella patagoniensis]|uniref:CPBP family intramembrane glutamic endopeptidase n=1 Tax=Shouchella patagoniensis TaxID=228576 RepID=UPI001FE94684|nr:type II CAAX endopeptidase family protein [Shouchella patagoniensis]